MIDVQQSRLRALEQDRFSFSRRYVQIMSRVTDKRAEAFCQSQHFVEDCFSVKLLATVSLDDAISIFQITFDARSQYLRRESIGSAYAATSRFVFIGRTDTAQ